MPGDLPTPVSVAVLLRDNGLSLTEAHDAVTRLAADRVITITLHPSNLHDLLADLGRHGLTAHVAHAVDRLKWADAS